MVGHFLKKMFSEYSGRPFQFFFQFGRESVTKIVGLTCPASLFNVGRNFAR